MTWIAIVGLCAKELVQHNTWLTVVHHMTRIHKHCLQSVQTDTGKIILVGLF